MASSDEEDEDDDDEEDDAFSDDFVQGSDRSLASSLAAAASLDFLCFLCGGWRAASDMVVCGTTT